MGALSPIGNDVETMWANAKAGVCGIGPITLYDTSDMKVKIAGEVKDFNVADHIDKREARKYDRFTQFAIVAARQAFEQSGLNMDDEDTARMGCVISSGIGGLDVIASEQMKGVAKGFDRLSPYFIPMVITNMAAGVVGIDLGLHGHSTCVVSACAGGTHAVGEAFRKIRDGYQDVMFAGGTEACVSPLSVGGFTVMRALTEESDISRASIPFDAERSGFVIGEGAGILCLEELEHAKARGANILGEVVGYGATCDAHHMTAPCPDGDGARRCMEEALNDGGLAPEEVDCINAHGTSTPMNDKGETMAIRNVFGAHADDILVSSTKSMTGHLLGATGAIEAILSVCTAREGYVPPTIHYQVPDPECDLNLVVNEGRDAGVKCVMSNSFGFGGQNAVAIFRRYAE